MGTNYWFVSLTLEDVAAFLEIYYVGAAHLVVSSDSQRWGGISLLDLSALVFVVEPAAQAASIR